MREKLILKKSKFFSLKLLLADRAFYVAQLFVFANNFKLVAADESLAAIHFGAPKHEETKNGRLYGECVWPLPTTIKKNCPASKSLSKLAPILNPPSLASKKTQKKREQQQQVAS